MAQELYIATNNGDMGGGEVMLLNIARAARSLGYRVTVIGPAHPPQLVETAADEGFARVVLPARTRSQYMMQLRAWHSAHKKVLLWCNGLVPAAATGGRKNRIVHLHQIPEGLNAKLVPFARCKASATLVPSNFMARQIKDAQVLSNWVSEVPTALKHDNTDVIRVGFIGRLSPIKGIVPLCKAIATLTQGGGAYRLVVAGEPVFTSEVEQEQVERSLSRIAEHTERLGWATPEALFNNVDMLVVPSTWEEPFGLVAAEAMSARVPLIVSDSGALPEIVGENYPYIVPKGDEAELARTISIVAEQLSSDSEKLTNTVSDAFWRWQELYSPEAGKERVREILEQHISPA